MTAFAPVVAIAPFCLLALFVIWLPVHLVWSVPFWAFAAIYAAGAVLMFLRPVQAVVLPRLFGARRPTPHERAVIEPLWNQIAQANHLPANRYLVRVLQLDELNAFACGGHLVVVTTFAIEHLPEGELAGVLAHELSHHLGLHTVATTIRHWLSLPVALLARIGVALDNVARAVADSFGSRSTGWGVAGRLASFVLTVASWPFLAALYLAGAIDNMVGHGSEFQADRRVVKMGYGRHLSAALRRVIDLGGSPRPIGWRDRLAASHPPARTRIAMIDAILRHPSG